MADLWRQCVRWLIDTGVLPRQHKTCFPDAKIFDLAQTLRDGVVLCNLLNAIQPGAIDVGRINIRPQMLQFLCLQNLHTVISTMENVFGISKYDLFEASDLYEMNNFLQVLRVLSMISYLPISMQKFRPFPSDTQSQVVLQRPEDEDIYGGLADLASERELADEEEDLYDSVPEADDGIYGSVIDFRRSTASLSKDRRSCCINEIVETERNYVNHLEMMKNKFIVPMRKFLNENEIRQLFANTEQLFPIHRELLQDIESAMNNNREMSQPFLKVKENLLLYGDYCSNLSQALTHLNDLVLNESISVQVENLQNLATPNKFKLRELLCVSMQRILKYHLLIKELSKQTNESHSDKKNLEKALEAMQEVAQYINEVKRDSETIQTINKVESCLVDYQMATPLISYGRLLKDGKLKIKNARDRRSQLRFTYLFDQALFVTNPNGSKNESYKLTDLIRLEDYILDENNQQKSTKWNWTWTLRDKYGSQSYTFYAKTTMDKTKWVENIRIAFDAIKPNELKGKDHSFKMTTFEKPTYCCHCGKLLLGCFFQGYLCTRTKKPCHKTCLLEAWKSNENGMVNSEMNSRIGNLSVTDSSPAVGKKQFQLPPLSSTQPSAPVGSLYKAHRDYNGIPSPPYPGVGCISFGVGEQVEVLEQVTGHWWMGRTLSQYDRKGYFPASYVSPFKTVKPAGLGPTQSYEPTIVRPRDRPSPLPPSPNAVSPTQLEDFEWFAGTLDRSGSDELLRGKPSGTYLVRTREGHLAISLVYHGDVKHIKIFQAKNQYYVTESITFKSVPELVKYYQNNLLSSSFFGLETSLLISYRGRPLSNNASSLPLPVTARPQQPIPQQPRSPGYPHINVNGQIFPIQGKARVLYDFDPQSAQELGLRTGQIVNLITKSPGDGWWKGECQDKIGYFPARFVQEIRM